MRAPWDLNRLSLWHLRPQKKILFCLTPKQAYRIWTGLDVLQAAFSIFVASAGIDIVFSYGIYTPYSSHGRSSALYRVSVALNALLSLYVGVTSAVAFANNTATRRVIKLHYKARWIAFLYTAFGGFFANLVAFSRFPRSSVQFSLGVYFVSMLLSMYELLSIFSVGVLPRRDMEAASSLARQVSGGLPSAVYDPAPHPGGHPGRPGRRGGAVPLDCDPAEAASSDEEDAYADDSDVGDQNNNNDEEMGDARAS
eukprot:PLAT11138.1.p1 GENE.PLAT11138.1~~PLAT11138.1.p1  ORF type:complete len:254 (+),score=24.12 PLAT11138.1:89-850(+)